jgi:hypothetical protein
VSRATVRDLRVHYWHIEVDNLGLADSADFHDAIISIVDNNRPTINEAAFVLRWRLAELFELIGAMVYKVLYKING